MAFLRDGARLLILSLRLALSLRKKERQEELFMDANCLLSVAYRLVRCERLRLQVLIRLLEDFFPAMR